MGCNLLCLHEAPSLRGVSRWLSAPTASLHWLTSLLRPPVIHGLRFVDVFTKHKQLGPHHIWACCGRGGGVYSWCAAVSRRQDQTELELLLLWEVSRFEELSVIVHLLSGLETGVYSVSTRLNSGSEILEQRMLPSEHLQLRDRNVSSGLGNLKGSEY